uniref:Uncharacterized protein n=1 Tax=Lepeophtheirus salmonis TaxID=72036 RepID=A0A0K2T787_LEPSM
MVLRESSGPLQSCPYPLLTHVKFTLALNSPRNSREVSLFKGGSEVTISVPPERENCPFFSISSPELDGEQTTMA